MITTENKLLNLINFIFYSGIACIAPFLSVHENAIGLTAGNGVWIHTASGLASILVCLLVGTIAERKGTKRYQICFSISLLLSILSYTALLAVPKIQRTPKQPEIDFDCSSPLTASINLEKCANFETCKDLATAWSTKTRVRLSYCGYQLKGPPLQICFRIVGKTTHHCLVYDPVARPILEFTADLSSWLFTEYRNDQNISVCNFVPATSGSIIQLNGRDHDAITCQRSENVTDIKCGASLERMDGKKANCFDIIGNLAYTFWFYLGLRTFADSFLICSVCLLEGITLRTIRGGRGSYGRSRVYPAFALIISSGIIGYFVDKISNFGPAYFGFATFELIVCILIFVRQLPVGGNTYRYDISPQTEQKNPITSEITVVLLLTLLAGIAWSNSQVFDPLLYQNIGFSHLKLGLTFSFAFLCALPFLFVSKNLIENIGEANLMAAAFAFYCLHLAGLSFVSEWNNMWWALPFEAMKAFAVPIFWVAAAAAVERKNSKGKRIALHYVLVIVHFAIGRLLGYSLGLFLTEKYSQSTSYRIQSAFYCTMAIFYMSFHHCYLKLKHRNISATRPSLNGSCLLFVEHLPINGRRNNN